MSLLQVKNLKKSFSIKVSMTQTKELWALGGVSFDVNKKETLAIVGESGCGKSTLAKTLMTLEKADQGQVIFEQTDITTHHPDKSIQMIFQDPYNSLNPRKKAWRLIAEPLLIEGKLSKKACFDRACELMEIVGLSKTMANRYPHMFSGGQRQRIGIARALSTDPKVLICDEPVSALDISIQAQVLNLLMKLQDDLDLTLIFISHDLKVVQHIADKIAVMYLGEIVEYANASEIMNRPRHPYTKALLASSLDINQQNESTPIIGETPSPIDLPTGCPFYSRCPKAKSENKERCQSEKPILEDKEAARVSCHFPY